MAIKEKEIYLDNLFAVDCKPDQRDSEISEFEKKLIESYLENIFSNIEHFESEIELISSNFFYETCQRKL